MATITTAAEIDIQLKGTESIKSLKTQIREAKDEAALMAQKFGEFSPQAIQATKKAAELKDQMEDLNHRINALNPDKFSRIATAASGIASGIAAAQGAMALFGAESEDAQKALVKVQGAMALSQGLQGLGDAKQGVIALAKTVSGSLKNAFTTAAGAARALGSALGIGLILLAVSLIVQYWEDIVELMGFGKTEAEKMGAIAKQNAEIEQQKLDKLDSQSNVLKLQGLSEREILNLKREQIKKVIEASEAELAAAKIRKQEQIESTKRYAGYLETALKFVSVPITLILKSIDAIGKFLGKDWGLEDKIFKPLANLVFDPEKTAKKGDEVISKQQEALDKLKNQQAGYELQVLAADKAANEKRIAANKKRNEEIAAENKRAAEEQKKLLDEANKIIEDAARANEERGKTNFQIKLDRLTYQFEKEKALLEAQGLSIKEIETKFAQDSADIWTEQLAKEYEDKVAADERRAAHDKLIADNELAEKEKIAAQKLAIEQSAYNAASAFSNLIGQLGNENLKVQKAQALIQIGIDTASAISTMVRDGAKVGVTPVEKGLAIASGIALVIANIAKATKILGATAPLPSIPQAQQFAAPNFNTQQQNQQSQTRVYVTETDITTAISRVQNLTKVGVVE